MGRPREFDEAEALAAAGNLFWQHGYHGTSLDDLVAAMGLARSSFYAAFGDKRSLYLRCLEWYRTRAFAAFNEDLSTPGSARAALEAALAALAAVAGHNGDPRGCFIVNAAAERLPTDDVVRATVTGTFDDMRQALIAVVRAGQATGELDATQRAEDVSDLLLAVIEGIRVLGKAGVTEERLRTAAEIAVARAAA